MNERAGKFRQRLWKEVFLASLPPSTNLALESPLRYAPSLRRSVAPSLPRSLASNGGGWRGISNAVLFVASFWMVSTCSAQFITFPGEPVELTPDSLASIVWERADHVDGDSLSVASPRQVALAQIGRASRGWLGHFVSLPTVFQEDSTLLLDLGPFATQLLITNPRAALTREMYTLRGECVTITAGLPEGQPSGRADLVGDSNVLYGFVNYDGVSYQFVSINTEEILLLEMTPEEPLSSVCGNASEDEPNGVYTESDAPESTLCVIDVAFGFTLLANA